MSEVEDGEIIDLDSIPLPSGQPQQCNTPENQVSNDVPSSPQLPFNLTKKWTPAVKNFYGRSRGDHSREHIKGALPQSNRRCNKQGPIWVPERESKSNSAPKPLTRSHPFFDDSPRSQPSKPNEENDILKIMHMLQDNPTLKEDLRDYFKDNSKMRNRGSRRKKKKAKAHSFEDLMNDYLTLVEKQEKSVKNAVPFSDDLDGEVIKSSRPALLPTPPIEKMQGFKSTFKSLNDELEGDIYSATPMELDSDDPVSNPPFTQKAFSPSDIDGQPLTPQFPAPPFPGPPPPFLNTFPSSMPMPPPGPMPMPPPGPIPHPSQVFPPPGPPQWIVPTQVYTSLEKLVQPSTDPLPPLLTPSPLQDETAKQCDESVKDINQSLLDHALYKARINASSSPENKEEVEEDSYASEEEMDSPNSLRGDDLPKKDEIRSPPPKTKEEGEEGEDLEALRMQLLHSIKNKAPTKPKLDNPILPIKVSPEVITVESDESSSSDERPPLIKRNSKRKMTDSHIRRKQQVSIDEAYEMVKKMPAIDAITFKKYYRDKKGDCSKKKAIDRAERLKITRLELLKDELHFNPFKKKWCVISMNTSKIPKDGFTWKKLNSYAKENKVKKGDSNNNDISKIIDKKQEKLNMFYEMVAKLDNGGGSDERKGGCEEAVNHNQYEPEIKEEVFTVSSIKSIDPKLLEQHLLQNISNKDKRISPKTRRVSPKVKDVSPNARAVPDVSPSETSSLPNNRNRKVSSDMVISVKSREKSEMREGNISRRKISGPGEVTDNKCRKISEDDNLEDMRELLLQSMIKKGRECKENVVLESNAVLPLVQLDLHKSPPQGTAINEALIPPQGTAINKALMPPQSTAINKALMPPQNTALNEAPMPPQSTALNEAPMPPQSTAINEALMPRDLHTTTTKEIQRSAETTKKIIADFGVNEDLRRPQKETFITPEMVREKKLLLKRITPVIKPIIIDVSDTESDSTIDSDQVVTPIKLNNAAHQLPSNDEEIEKARLSQKRSELTIQTAQLERRLVQYTHKRKQHMSEHVKHIEKLALLENQYNRAQKIVAASTEILKTLTHHQKISLDELKRSTCLAADLELQIENPSLWRERKYSNSSEKCPLLPSPLPTTEGPPPETEVPPTIIDVEKGTSREEEEEEQQDESESSSDVEEEEEEVEPGELLSDQEKEGDTKEEDHIESSRPETPDSSITSAEQLLTYFTEHVSDDLDYKNDWCTEMKEPQIKFWDSNSSKNLHTPQLLSKARYKSPLVMFRSYRFSPYFRTKHGYQLNSATFSHNIDHSVPLCPHELHGKCKDRNCTRQHNSSKITGSELRQQLCQSVGLSLSIVTDFEQSHPSLSQSQLSLLFCNHINVIRTDRRKEYNFINTAVVPKTKNCMKFNYGIKETLDSYCHKSPGFKVKCEKGKSGRYYDATEITLTKHCKLHPKNTVSWLELAQCQMKRGATPSVVSGTLSRALQHNKHSPELWAEFLTVKAPLVSSSDLSTLYTQAIKLAPSPILWRRLTPTLGTLPARLDALSAALSACDSDKKKYMCYRGEIRKDRLWLLERGGMSLEEEFETILGELAEYQDKDILWFILQYLHYSQRAALPLHPHNAVPDQLSGSSLDTICSSLNTALDIITEEEVALRAHRLYAGLFQLKEGPESAIRYLSAVTEDHAELYELMEDIVLRKGWVEPNVPWPRLCLLQMEALVDGGHIKSALVLGREMALVMCGLQDEDTNTDTLQLYREMLGLNVGVSVTEELLCFTQPPHITWLYLCYGYLARLSRDRVLEEASALTLDVHSPLGILKHAITVETTTHGVHLLWARYFDYLEEDIGHNASLADTFVSDIIHCLKTVPTIYDNDYTFHNKVIIRLLSHVREDWRTEHHHRLAALLPDNAELLKRCALQAAKTNPKSAVLTLQEYLATHSNDAQLWIMTIQLSQRCQTTLETRAIAAEALSWNPLHSLLLKQVFLFELQAATDDIQKKQLAQWSFNFATEKGIKL